MIDTYVISFRKEHIDTVLRNRNIANEQEIASTCKSYGQVFLLLDAVFSDLNISRQDYKVEIVDRLRDNTNLLLSEWIRMGLSITPKVHILMDHAIPQLIATQGFADMREDRIEKPHEDKMKNEARLIRLRNIKSKIGNQAKQQEIVKI